MRNAGQYKKKRIFADVHVIVSEQYFQFTWRVVIVMPRVYPELWIGEWWNWISAEWCLQLSFSLQLKDISFYLTLHRAWSSESEYWFSAIILFAFKWESNDLLFELANAIFLSGIDATYHFHVPNHIHCHTEIRQVSNTYFRLQKNEWIAQSFACAFLFFIVLIFAILTTYKFIPQAY